MSYHRIGEVNCKWLIDTLLHLLPVKCQLVLWFARQARKNFVAELPLSFLNWDKVQDIFLHFFDRVWTLHNMAQSTMACSPLGVSFIWDKGYRPEIDWEKWPATVKLVIMLKYYIQVIKLLQPKQGSEDLDYPLEATNLFYQIKCQPKEGSENNAIWKRKKNSLEKHLHRHWGQRTTIRQYTLVRGRQQDKKRKNLSLGAESTNIFHQSLPHTDL